MGKIPALGQCSVSAYESDRTDWHSSYKCDARQWYSVIGRRISLDGREMRKNGTVQFSKSIELDLMFSTHRAF